MGEKPWVGPDEREDKASLGVFGEPLHGSISRYDHGTEEDQAVTSPDSKSSEKMIDGGQGRLSELMTLRFVPSI